MSRDRTDLEVALDEFEDHLYRQGFKQISEYPEFTVLKKQVHEDSRELAARRDADEEEFFW